MAVSLDTYKSAVAEAGIHAGADLINDIWGLKYDEKMAAVIAKYDKACCLMHNRENTDYTDYLADVVSDLDESVNMALAAGIDRDKIMVDPGIGFAKDLHQNLLLMNNLELLHKWDLPILLGTSRKSMIGLTLDLPGDRARGGNSCHISAWACEGLRFLQSTRCEEQLQSTRHDACDAECQIKYGGGVVWTVSI